jgi:hypothetical protein
MILREAIRTRKTFQLVRVWLFRRMPGHRRMMRITPLDYCRCTFVLDNSVADVPVWILSPRLMVDCERICKEGTGPHNPNWSKGDRTWVPLSTNPGFSPGRFLLFSGCGRDHRSSSAYHLRTVVLNGTAGARRINCFTALCA